MVKNAVNTPSAVLSFDSQPFFSASHPVGPLGASGDIRDTVASNINSGGSGPYWFLLDASRAIRPFIFQLRREYAMTRMDTVNDEAVFNRREFRFGVDGRANTGVGLWQLAYASNMDLSNPVNYGAARAAMRSFKTDAGLPFGALTSPDDAYLVVPPVLEEQARQLLHADFMVGAFASSNVPASNIWKGSANLIVSEYLA
jgi:phage major head subunit gpT-like protein